VSNDASYLSEKVFRDLYAVAL